MAITSFNQLDLTKRYTYADYLLWQFQERVELFKGWVLKIAAPSSRHQEIVSRLNVILWNAVHKKGCKVYVAPFDVRLPLPPHKITSDKIDTVVQPDLCVVCDLSKIKRQGCLGAPELVVEILSPSNAKREMRDKYELYEAAGVLEYWMVNPVQRVVWVYVLQNEQFVNASRPLIDEDVLQSPTFSNITVDLSDVFPDETEELEDW